MPFTHSPQADDKTENAFLILYGMGDDRRIEQSRGFKRILLSKESANESFVILGELYVGRNPVFNVTEMSEENTLDYFR
jgi:hypothetical protein